MGVSGFTTYIDNNNYLLENYKLKNSKLVIDGNNFYHFIYHHYQVPHVYGGDYRQFAKICYSFFESFLACNVTPYVVFDGAYDLTDVKFKSAITRASKKMMAAHSVSQGESHRVIPLHTHEAFIEILNDLNVKHVTCNYEADNHTASMAAIYNCPVLTNDSDFFVFSLPAGVILLDYLDVVLRRDHEGVFYMKAQLFSVQKLVDHMKLPNASFVALFATVLGNDIVDKKVFELFLSRFSLSNLSSNKRKGRRFAKITGLFKWLSGKRDVEGAIKELINECPLEKREKIRTLVRLSMDSYCMTHTYLEDFFELYDIFSKSHFNCDERMVNTLNEECPKWFQSGLNRGEISSRVVNLWMSGKVILQPQIGSHGQESSHLASRHVRKLIHLLIMNGRVSEFREYVKKDGKLSRQTVKSDFNFTALKNPACFEDLFNLSKEESTKIYLEAFPNEENMFLSFSEKLSFIISVILYWVDVSKPLKTHVLSLLLGIFAPGVMMRMVPFEVNSEEDLETAVGNHLSATKHRKKYFNMQAIHSFAQFQSCLQWLGDLNSLLNYPFPPHHLSSSFNSSSLLFINYYLENNSNNLEGYLKMTFCKVSDDLEFIMDIFGRLSFKNSSNLSNDNTETNYRKNLNRKNPKMKIATSADDDSGEEEPDANDNYNDFENKFSCLNFKINS